MPTRHWLDRPIPTDFTDPNTGIVDWDSMIEDLIGRLLQDHVGFAEGITTEELSGLYFSRNDVETLLLMGEVIQRLRTMLFRRGIFLKSTNQRWHIAASAQEKMEFLKNRTRRIIAAYRRTLAQYTVAADQHAEIGEHPLFAALQRAEGAFLSIEEAEKKRLPPGRSSE